MIQSPFAILYLARDEALERDVVIKSFAVDADNPEPPFDREEWLRRFLIEGRLAARLDHPNLLGLFESGVDETGAPYHVMPFMRTNLPRLIGLDLSESELEGATEIERPKSLPEVEAVRILRHVVAGLAHLHAKGIVHRDVKATNVLLSARENGLPKLCDFGMVKLGPKRDLPVGAWIGTPDYISPEQKADAGLVTTAADMFSVGVLAWRMLSGHRPKGGQPPLPEGLRPRLVQAVNACLSPDPAARPGAEEFLTALLAPIEKRISISIPAA